MAQIIEIPGAHIAPASNEEQATKVTPAEMMKNMAHGTYAVELVAQLQPQWLLPFHKDILGIAQSLVRTLRHLDNAENGGHHG